MEDIDQLVNRAVHGVTTISGKAARFASKLAIGVAIVCVGSFLLGIAALSGGIEKVWIVLGIVFAAIAVGCALVARWRVGSVKRHVPELATEVRTLLTESKDRTETVIDTFLIDEDADGERDPFDGGSAIMIGRQMYGFRSVVGSGLESSARLTSALSAVTSFPGLVFAAIAVSMVFGFLGVIFLLSLAL